MSDKFELFKERMITLRNLHEGTLVDYKRKVAETSLWNLIYQIKWGFQDLVPAEYLYKKYFTICDSIDAKEEWKENILKWVEQDVKGCQEQIYNLSVMNSTGMMHNAFGFYELKATSQYVNDMKRIIRDLKKEDES